MAREMNQKQSTGPQMYINPYANIESLKCLKINFHTHGAIGANEHGFHTLDEIKSFYKELGFHAVCITNIDEYTETGHLSDSLYFMPGVEYGGARHMLTIGVRESFHACSHQEAIDKTKAAGGFTVLAHPNWMRQGYWPRQELDCLTGFIGIEVINMLIARFSGSALGTDAWDHLLSSGKLVWGFGNDDFVRFNDAGRSFNYVFAEKCDDAAIQDAVYRGRFVASTGLLLEYLVLEGDTIQVMAKHPVETYDNMLTYRFVGEEGEVKTTATADRASYTLHGEKYIRVEVESPNGMRLFCQPVYNSTRLRKNF